MPLNDRRGSRARLCVTLALFCAGLGGGGRRLGGRPPGSGDPRGSGGPPDSSATKHGAHGVGAPGLSVVGTQLEAARMRHRERRDGCSSVV